MKEFIKKVFEKATLYFAVGIIFYSLAMISIYADDTSLSLDPCRAICFFPFCVCFGIANTALKYKGIEAFTRWLIHFVLTVAGAFVFVILPAGLEGSSANFMGLIITLVIYIAGALVYALFNIRVKAAIKEDEKLKNKSVKRK